VAAVSTVLAARLPDAPAAPDLDPAARYGCSGRVLKLLLLGLADRSDEHGADAWPGIRELSRVAMCSLDTVRVGLAHLQLLGLAERVEHPADGRRADVWCLDLDALAKLSTSARVTRTPVERVTRAHRTGLDPRATARVRPAHNVPTSLRPDTSDAVSDHLPHEHNCGHRWRSASGECPVCLTEDVENTA
jgi:hypothetical protein